MSKSNRTLESPDVLSIKNSTNTKMRIPLFIKKNNDEGDNFYYMGDVFPIENSFKQKIMAGKSVVQLVFKMNYEVEQSLYNYITDMN